MNFLQPLASPSPQDKNIFYIDQICLMSYLPCISPFVPTYQPQLRHDDALPLSVILLHELFILLKCWNSTCAAP